MPLWFTNSTRLKKTGVKMDGKYLRPQIHFTPSSGMMSDPDGLYYDGKSGLYHIFFQYQKDPKGDLYVCWKHAVSRNLIDFTERETVLFPDEYGVIFSGSACVDEKNVSGYFDDSTAEKSRALLFYTNCNLSDRSEFQACAKGNGEAFVKINGGAPIIENKNFIFGKNFFRDPKIFRFKDKWLLITGGGKVRLFSSDNLTDWRFESEIDNVEAEAEEINEDLETLRKYLPLNDPYSDKLISECPDIFPLKTADGEEKFVLSGAGIYYIVGRMECRCGSYCFIPETGKRRSVYGDKFFSARYEPYAAQTFFNSADGRRIAAFWLRQLDSGENTVYNGALSLPQELELIRKNDSYFMTVSPIKEFLSLPRRLVKRGKIKSKVSLKHSLTAIPAEIKLIDTKNFYLKINAGKDSVCLNCVNGDINVKTPYTEKIISPIAEKFDLMALIDYNIIEFWYGGNYYASGAYDGGKFDKLIIGSKNSEFEYSIEIIDKKR